MTAPVDVRPAAPKDAPAVRAVAEAAWWETYPGVLDPDTIRNALDNLYDEAFLRQVLAERDDLLFLVAERETEGGAGGDNTADVEIVGFATAQQTWADEAEVHTLYVHPDRWGNGIGTELLDAVAESARTAGVDRLRCTVASGNHVGRAFLESRGFERIETVTAEVGDEIVPEDVFERDV